MKITSEGCPHLGVPLGSPNYVSQYVSEKVQQWSKELKLLSAVATTQPHAAFAAYTHGMTSKWSYLIRTVTSIGHHLKVLEISRGQISFLDILRSDLHPPPNDVEMKLMALPERLGGLGIGIPSLNSGDAFDASLLVTAPLRKLIYNRDIVYTYQALADQMTAKSDIQRKRREQARDDANNLRNELTPVVQKAMDIARERGSSSWLTALPLEEHGFSLHKVAVVHALALRYG